MRIELTSSAWKAKVLPLNELRIFVITGQLLPTFLNMNQLNMLVQVPLDTLCRYQLRNVAVPILKKLLSGMFVTVCLFSGLTNHVTQSLLQIVCIRSSNCVCYQQHSMSFHSVNYSIIAQVPRSISTVLRPISIAVS